MIDVSHPNFVIIKPLIITNRLSNLDSSRIPGSSPITHWHHFVCLRLSFVWMLIDPCSLLLLRRGQKTANNLRILLSLPITYFCLNDILAHRRKKTNLSIETDQVREYIERQRRNVKPLLIKNYLQTRYHGEFQRKRLNWTCNATF